MLADQIDLVNKYLDHPKRMQTKILSRKYSSQQKKVVRKLLKIRIRTVRAAAEGKQLVIEFFDFEITKFIKNVCLKHVYSFGGTGYRLGQLNDDHVALPSAQQNPSQNMDPIILRLWRQGFTINDSDLRTYEEKKNKEFLEYIMKG